MADLFNASWYLSQNPDIKAAVQAGLISAREHFELHGKTEGRSPGPLFDPQHYLNQNPDIKAAVEAGLLNAYDHFVNYGMHESRSPMSLFNVEFYLQQNPDVKAAVEGGLISAVEHFLSFGQNEARYIDPFINLGAYLNANPDVKGAVGDGMSALEHLMLYGVSEGRDLGNGINLGIFTNDPAFKDALASSDIAGAMSRVEDVAPFLPTFKPAPNWTAPANTPIPTDFIPPEGTKLVVPPTVTVPDGTTLPDTFEPVDEGNGGGDNGGGGTPATFTAKLINSVLTFEGTAKGDITVTIDGSVATFERGSLKSEVENFNLVTTTVALEEDQTLVLNSSQVALLQTNGKGSIKVELSSVGTLSGNENTNINNLLLKLDNANISLPDVKEFNVLVDPSYIDGDKTLKTLQIEASGHSGLNLGNHKLGDEGVGYFLESVDVTGGAAGGTLNISTLYFGSENTKFDSTEYGGDVTLNAYIYNGQEDQYNWSINFGEGADTLIINKDGNGNYPGINGSVIDGGTGEGRNTLELHKDVYANWAAPNKAYTNADNVSNFHILKTEAVSDRTYESTLLGNKFDTLALTSAGNSTGITASGFEKIDASTIQNGIEITVTSTADGTEVVTGSGNDTIRFGVDTTVTGGAGNDTFTVTASAGTGQATKQLFITDYKANDVIDLTEVENLELQGSVNRLEIHQGGKTGGAWGSNPQGTQDDVLVQLSGGSGAQLIVKGAYESGTTLAFKVTQEQAGLSQSDVELDFLVNITEGGEIDASEYTGGAILSGGGGSQTLIGSSGEDLIIGGSGNDILSGGDGNDVFSFSGNFGIDVILDFHPMNDEIRINGDLFNPLLPSGGPATLADLDGSVIYQSIYDQLKEEYQYDDNQAITVLDFTDGGDTNAVILIGELLVP